ncbi:MAG: hypothetical protein ABIG89_04395 [Candidatus Woesearchaeota archaeon]
MKNKHKKSQTEIMGLMIIVVIITLVVLFVVSVVYFKPTDDFLESYIQKDLSASIIGAMLKTDSGCTKDTTIEDLLIDMVRAGGGSTITCNLDMLEQRYSNMDACKDINMGDDAAVCAISLISESLKEMGRPFHLKIKAGTLKIIPDIKHLEEEFARAKSVEVTPYTLPIYPTDEVLEIWLCVGGECPNI